MNPTAMQRLGRRIGCTEGQAWTVLLGGALGVLLASTGLPGALGTDVARIASPAAAAAEPLPPVTGPPAVVAPVPSPVGGAPFPDLEGLRPLPAAQEPLPPEAQPPSGVARPTQPSASSGPRTGLLDAGWGYAATGTPLDDLERALVPAGGLPVTARSGGVNKVSFLRLRLPGTTLRLSPVQDTGANQLESAAAVVVCTVTTRGWRGSEGQDLRAAPRYDCGPRAARGVLQGDGSWVFDLSDVPLEAGVRELALVPADTASDFQVVFDRPAP